MVRATRALVVRLIRVRVARQMRDRGVHATRGRVDRSMHVPVDAQMPGPEALLMLGRVARQMRGPGDPPTLVPVGRAMHALVAPAILGPAAGGTAPRSAADLRITTSRTSQYGVKASGETTSQPYFHYTPACSRMCIEMERRMPSRFCLVLLLAFAVFHHAPTAAQPSTPVPITFNLKATTPGENSALSGECDGTTESPEITCRFIQVTIRQKPKPKDVRAEVDRQMAELLAQAENDPKQLTDALCTEVRKSRVEVERKVQAIKNPLMKQTGQDFLADAPILQWRLWRNGCVVLRSLSQEHAK